MPGGAQSAASLEASRPLDSELMRRGVSLLTVYLDSVRNDKPTVECANWLHENGGESALYPPCRCGWSSSTARSPSCRSTLPTPRRALSSSPAPA